MSGWFWSISGLLDSSKPSYFVVVFVCPFICSFHFRGCVVLQYTNTSQLFIHSTFAVDLSCVQSYYYLLHFNITNSSEHKNIILLDIYT